MVTSIALHLPPGLLAMLTPIPLAQAQAEPFAFSEQLMATFQDTGFALISGHGVPEDLLNAVKAEAAAFFALPEAAKRAYAPAGGRGQRGYTPFGVEGAKGSGVSDLKEFWHVGRETPTGGGAHALLPENLWPAERPAFRPAMLALYAHLESVGLQVLAGVARGLGQPDGFFDAPVKDGDSILRLLHYPPVAPGAAGVRAGAHEDINVITLLLGAEEAGLELLHRDGGWRAVSPPPGALVVNVGDMLQRLTAGALRSTTHRVVNPAPERSSTPRYSFPFFLHFAPDYRIDPAVLGLETKDPAYAPIRAGDYLLQRLQEIGLA